MPWCRMLRPRSLRGRLWRDAALGVLVAAACYAAALAAVAHAGSDWLARNGLEGQAEDVGEQLSRDADGALHVALGPRVAHLYAAHAAHLKYRILDAQGRTLVSSESSRLALARNGQAVALSADRFVFGNGGTRMQAVTVPFNFEGRPLWIQVARSDDFLDLAEQTTLPAMQEAALVCGGIALLVIVLGVGWSLPRALAPVRVLSEAAKNVGLSTLDAPLSRTATPTELLPLVDAMNGAFARVQEGYLAQSRFIANAAHELKTPLTILRGRCELHGAPAEVLREIDHMARIVSQMLHLAEASYPGSYGAPTRVDLGDVARLAIAQLQFPADARGLDIALAVAGAPRTIMGHAPALTMAVRNLLENAIRHSPAGGRIEVVIEPRAISVTDAGQGLPEGPHARLFERFWRSDARGHGAGLGLSIVREVMHAHGGSATARARTDGPGAMFRLELP
jgi:two-component system sensor histidine kinase QseC